PSAGRTAQRCGGGGTQEERRKRMMKSFTGKLIVAALVKYLVVEINSIGKTYNLNNGEQKNFTNLLSEIPYSFIINMKKDQTANISINMNYMTPQPFSFLNIYEYSPINIVTRYDKKRNINIISEKNELKASFLYSASSNATYIRIKIIPNLNINYLMMKISIGGCSYDLKEGVSNNFTNLIASNVYYFYIEASLFQKLFINFTINYMSKQPFNSLKIKGLNSRDSTYDFFDEKNQAPMSFVLRKRSPHGVDWFD
ncbi:MAG: hypothetical protein II663_03690, partial [Bacteroidales bacterium]|nr:hypothetical protein [Bacteroidales bacterium]